MSEYQIETDVEYLLYIFEQRALSLKGVALHYDCECFQRSAGSLQMKRAEDQADQWGRAADEYYNNMAADW